MQGKIGRKRAARRWNRQWNSGGGCYSVRFTCNSSSSSSAMIIVIIFGAQRPESVGPNEIRKDFTWNHNSLRLTNIPFHSALHVTVVLTFKKINFALKTARCKEEMEDWPILSGAVAVKLFHLLVKYNYPDGESYKLSLGNEWKCYALCTQLWHKMLIVFPRNRWRSGRCVGTEMPKSGEAKHFGRVTSN